MNSEKKVLTAVEKNKDQLYEILKDLIRFPTENPPGNEAPAQQWFADRLRKASAEVDIFEPMPGRPNVVGILKGTEDGRSVILNGHMDVVEARQRESWQHDPFEPVVRDGMMFGRGASDMKSALAAYLFVLETMKDKGIRLKGDVFVQSVVGEEAAEPGTKAAAERYPADFAIVGEGTRSRQIVASVGTLTAKITIKSPYTLHLHARRLALHAGGGVEGANAIEKMALRIIPALNDLEREWSVFKNHWAIPPAQTLINPFLIQGGSTAGYLPDECTMYVIVVYLPTEQPNTVQKEVENQIRRAAELDGWLRLYPPLVEWNPSEQPWVFPASDLKMDHHGIRALSRIIEDMSGEKVQYGGRGGITDAGWFPLNGTPAVVYGPGDVHWAHRVDERVSLEDVVLYAKIISIFLMRWCGVE
jgi:acetylornithine deacetylase